MFYDDPRCEIPAGIRKDEPSRIWYSLDLCIPLVYNQYNTGSMVHLLEKTVNGTWRLFHKRFNNNNCSGTGFGEYDEFSEFGECVKSLGDFSNYFFVKAEKLETPVEKIPFDMVAQNFYGYDYTHPDECASRKIAEVDYYYLNICVFDWSKLEEPSHWIRRCDRKKSKTYSFKDYERLISDCLTDPTYEVICKIGECCIEDVVKGSIFFC